MLYWLDQIGFQVIHLTARIFSNYIRTEATEVDKNQIGCLRFFDCEQGIQLKNCKHSTVDCQKFYQMDMGGHLKTFGKCFICVVYSTLEINWKKELSDI